VGADPNEMFRPPLTFRQHIQRPRGMPQASHQERRPRFIRDVDRHSVRSTPSLVSSNHRGAREKARIGLLTLEARRRDNRRAVRAMGSRGQDHFSEIQQCHAAARVQELQRLARRPQAALLELLGLHWYVHSLSFDRPRLTQYRRTRRRSGGRTIVEEHHDRTSPVPYRRPRYLHEEEQRRTCQGMLSQRQVQPHCRSE